jgi:hypothetical protein
MSPGENRGIIDTKGRKYLLFDFLRNSYEWSYIKLSKECRIPNSFVPKDT